MIIVEPQCVGLEHAKINSCYLGLMLRLNYLKNNSLFFAENKHSDAIKSLNEDIYGKIQVISILVPSKKSSLILKIIKEFINFRKIYSNKNSNLILFLSTNYIHLFLIKIFTILSKKETAVVLHGSLEAINKSENGSTFKFYLMKYFLLYFNFNKITYIVNSPHILNNLIEVGLNSNIVLIQLPYDLYKAENLSLKNIDNPRSCVHFRSAGFASIAKGIDLFFDLSHDLESYTINKLCNFKHLGLVKQDSLIQLNKNIINIPCHCNSPLSELEYSSELENTDYLIFFYPINSYRFSLSGVLLDAIKYEIPIIALNNDMFDFYFKEYGHFGWLFDDYISLKNKVESLINDGITPNEALIFKESFCRIKKYLINNKFPANLDKALRIS